MAGDLLEESSVQAVVIPNIQEPAPAQVLPQQQTQTQPGTTPSTTPPSAATPSTSVEMQPLPGSSSQLGKRSRDDGDTSEEGDAKRSKVTQEAAVIPTITITDENAKVVTHIEPQTQTLQESDRGQGISVTTSTTDLGQAGCQETPQQIFEQQEDERVLCQVQEVQEGPVEEEQGGDGDVIVVGSDEEEVETNMQVSATLEYEVGQDQEVEDESDEDADSEDEQIDEGGEFDEDQENDVDEEDDNDVVIIDIDENEQQDSQIPVGQGETSTVTGAVSSPRPPPPLQPVPHTERLPSTSRSQLTPFLLGQGGPFDDDDCTVPSTPTLSLPRRTDGFAEALNSPHVSQRFVFSGGVEVPVQPELAQLESQRALGMDDTRMDLSQFDDAGGRSMSSTPTPLQMSAGAALEATAVTAAVTAAPAGQSQETSGITSSYPGLFLGQGEGQPSAPESSEQQMDLTSESSQGQEDASATTTQASLAEGGMGDEEESNPRSTHQLVHAACVEVPRQQGQGHPWYGGVDLGVGDSNSSIHLGAWEHDIPAEECTEDSFRSFSKEKRPINLKSYRKWEKQFNELVHLASLVDGWMETTREAPYYYAMTSLDSLQSSLNSSVQDLPTCLQTSSLEQEEVKPADCTNFPVFSSPRKFGIGLKENGHIDCTSYLTPKSSYLFDSDFSSLLFHCVLPPTSQTGTIYLQ
ncbi:hypothetical protein C0Q70_16530 [Pomacea canaliculata]|uniref:Uncharacterized protein n=1 Tax=Pomacea canaliculata TaxID=400727 RepID=A0A2T7NQ42_POMCA|nr:hypothetical protein C0Q70_16530 [Pomacea canaliculata]